jgi:hypothetical protein
MDPEVSEFDSERGEPADAAAADEVLAVGPRRLPRNFVRATAALLATAGVTIALVLVGRPQVQAGHGTVAAATAARARAEHAVSGTPRGNPIRGYFLM